MANIFCDPSGRFSSSVFTLLLTFHRLPLPRRSGIWRLYLRQSFNQTHHQTKLLIARRARSCSLKWRSEGQRPKRRSASIKRRSTISLRCHTHATIRSPYTLCSESPVLPYAFADPRCNTLEGVQANMDLRSTSFASLSPSCQ